MEKLMTKQNLMYAGIGVLTAFVVYKLLVNREEASVKASINSTASKSTDETSSSFCGCGA